MTISLNDRRLMLTAYRYAFNGTPAAAAAELVDFAVARGLIEPRRPIAGETLRDWASDPHSKPPAWAAQAASVWLQEHGYDNDAAQQGRAEKKFHM